MESLSSMAVYIVFQKGIHSLVAVFPRRYIGFCPPLPKMDSILRVHHNTKWVGNGLKLNWGKFQECW